MVLEVSVNNQADPLLLAFGGGWYSWKWMARKQKKRGRGRG
jgi:hypothetical protein